MKRGCTGDSLFFLLKFNEMLMIDDIQDMDFSI
jgi:hypothetical protein